MHVVGSDRVGSGRVTSRAKVESRVGHHSGRVTSRVEVEPRVGRVGSKITSRITMVIRLVILGVRVDHPSDHQSGWVTNTTMDHQSGRG